MNVTLSKHQPIKWDTLDRVCDYCLGESGEIVYDGTVRVWNIFLPGLGTCQFQLCSAHVEELRSE